MGRQGRLAAVCACLILAGTTWFCRAQAPTQNQEYALKAAFMLNFLKFIDWPEDVVPADSPYTVAVLGTDPFGPVLDSTMSDRAVRGRAVRVVRYPDIESMVRSKESIQVLFLTSSLPGGPDPALSALATTSVLTVGDSPDFCKRGGVIGFVTLDNRLKFNVNMDSAKRMRLKVSSQLLKLANSVQEGTTENGGDAKTP